MNGGRSQSDRILIDAFNAAIEARAFAELGRWSERFLGDRELTKLELAEMEASRTAKDALRGAGIDPEILSEILL